MKTLFLCLGVLGLLVGTVGCVGEPSCPDVGEPSEAAGDSDDGCDVEVLAPAKTPVAAKVDKDQYCVPSPAAPCTP